MSDRAAARLAWALLALGLACSASAVAVLIEIRNDPALDDAGAAQVVFASLGILTFAGVGALVAARRPRNLIGWLLLVIGLGIALSLATGGLVELEKVHPGSVPATSAIASISSNSWFVTLLALPQLLLRLPSGRLTSPRWRFANWLTIGMLLCAVTLSFKPGPLADYPEFHNPVAIPGFDRVSAVLEPVGLLLFTVLMLAAAASIILRFRRARGVERLQLKWVAFSVVSCAVLWAAGELPLGGWLSDVLTTLGLVAFCLVPVSIGVAVLRYRLYDIDRVISKTLVYACLTLILGVAYAGLVLVSQALFSSVAGGGDLAIAASTLVVAALFLPLRSRLQRLVDRRFYRRRYDAQRTLEAFGARLRRQVELDGLRSDLEAAVHETMQPAHVSLWLRGARP